MMSLHSRSHHALCCNPEGKVFYYLDANFTTGGGERPAKGRQAYLFTIDPTTGESSQTSISGAVDFPVGYAFHPEVNTVRVFRQKFSLEDAHWFPFAII
jgi:hypothetical protein